MTPRANAAIEVDSKFDLAAQGGIYGIQVAADGFLKAFARHARAGSLMVLAQESHLALARAALAESGRDDLPLVPLARQDELSRAGCLMRYDLPLATNAWFRRTLGERAYSLCGLTHSLSGSGVYRTLWENLMAPLQPWDALICTSRAAKAMLTRYFQGHAEYLAARGAPGLTWVAQLPVIPLGVALDSFPEPAAMAATRQAFRAAWEIDAEDVAVLFVGRLNLTSKAHPFAMFAALEAAARRNSRRLHFLMAGWFPAPALRQSMATLAHDICPSVRVAFIERPDEERKRQALYGSDMFLSLSDNIQETFGLAPVEAMAAGLPTVVSDWDGYRDTVLDGLTGLTVPTVMAPPGLGEDFGERHGFGIDDYPRYLVHASQCTAVDIAKAAEALANLAGDAELRARMGAAGRARVRDHLDWRHVIATCQELWAELAARRAGDAGLGLGAANPLHPDPFTLFQDFTSAVLDGDMRLRPASGDGRAALRRALSSPLLALAAPHLAPRPTCEAVLARLAAEGPLPAGRLLDMVPAEARPRLHRTLAWLLKMDVLAVG
ncbi:MAG: glycosyltransferase family 4 protein [Rhodospirillales bacterium]|nr:glycosyltransferase family 4 protein [Rhodospirillales bacterium]